MKFCHGTCDNWRPKVDRKFYSVSDNHLGAAQQNKLAMEKQMEYYYFGLEDTNVKKMIDNVIKSIECD